VASGIERRNRNGRKMKQMIAVGSEAVSWDDLSLVASIAEFDSLRQAAKGLGMNASTLVRHMERLETDLGTTIFDRLPQGFMLNGTGKMLAEIGRDMQRHFLRVQEIASQDERPKGQVKIAVTEGLGTFWIAPKLPQFALDNPEIVINMESTMAIRSPLRNEADIAIQFRKPDNPDLIAAKLCHLHVYPFATLRYLEKFGMPSTEDRKTRHKIIIQETEQVTNDVIAEFLKRSKLEADIAFITNSSIGHLYAVERGLGIGGLPTFSMAMGGRLIPIDIGIQHSMEVFMIYRKDARRLKRVSIAIDWLRQIFNPQRYPWFAPAFMHPADIVRTLNQTMERSEVFDSPQIKEFLEGTRLFALDQFKRPVGRPPALRR
jgi:DNA-binding transcriptional LysR family regulator